MTAPIPAGAFAAALPPATDTNAPTSGAEPVPTLIPSRRADGWTAEAQRTFLGLIAEGLKVEAAAAGVGLSPASAYQLRRRAAGAAFALGWRAASLVARDRVADDLMARAMHGQIDRVTRADGSVVTRHRFDNKLAMNLLARLDRQVESAPDADVRAARLVAQEFDAFLGGLTDEADAARAGLFLARRGLGAEGDARDLGPVLALAAAERLACVGVATAGEVAVADLDPARRAEWSAEQWQRAEAAGLLALAATPAPQNAPACEECEDSSAADLDGAVWFDDERDEWRTNFAAPPGFDGEEQGDFGDDLYERALSWDEEQVVLDRAAAARALRCAEDAVYRDAWFGFVPDAGDPDGDGDGDGDTDGDGDGDGAVADADASGSDGIGAGPDDGDAAAPAPHR